jgi:hypothetical protein
MKLKTLTMNQWLQQHTRHSSRGAPMGQVSDDIAPGTKVHVERLDWVDYDYLRDGTFFGRVQGETMYAIWCDDVDGTRLCIYCRFKSRREAVRFAIDEHELVPLRGNPKEIFDEPAKRPDRAPSGAADSTAKG